MGRLDHVAIVGGGFSGTLQAIALLRAGVPRVSLIERRPAMARGVAYSTGNPAHLLNVRTANMSAFDDDPDHFRRWLSARTGGADPLAQGFASRRDYGDYLADVLRAGMAASPDRLSLVHGHVVEVERRADGMAVLIEDGRRIVADAAILALGNLPPHDPPGIAGAALPADLYAGDPWRDGLADGLGPDDTVLLVGTGLTMVDVALTLEGAGFAGSIVALSRHGLMPRAHDVTAPVRPEAMARPAVTGSALLRHFRRLSAEQGWRTTVDRIRPHVQSLWRGASHDGRSRFIRHLRSWWDVHRHRLSPTVAARIDALRDGGRLSIVAGRIAGCVAGAGEVAVDWRPRGEDVTRRMRVRRIVNCTGPQGDLLRTREPLLHLLLASGSIRPDPHRLGIDVTPDGETIDINGHANPRLLAIGPMTRGAFWEIVAVPDIRVQTRAMACRLSKAGGWPADPAWQSPPPAV